MPKFCKTKYLYSLCIFLQNVPTFTQFQCLNYLRQFRKQTLRLVNMFMVVFLADFEPVTFKNWIEIFWWHLPTSWWQEDYILCFSRSLLVQNVTDKSKPCAKTAKNLFEPKVGSISSPSLFPNKNNPLSPFSEQTFKVWTAGDTSSFFILITNPTGLRLAPKHT